LYTTTEREVGVDDEARLPFRIEVHTSDGRATVSYVAIIDGQQVACGRYTPGSLKDRHKLAAEWAEHPRLSNGKPLPEETVRLGLERAEMDVIADQADDEEEEHAYVREIASHIDANHIAELAWNVKTGSPDFIVHDRNTGEVGRTERIELDDVRLIPPKCAAAVCTPGGHVPGSVLLPVEHDESGADVEQLRRDVLAFINRYVELPGDAPYLAATYAELSWLFDAFDEVPYLGFKTSDIGRGKSRALETVGALCYRPILAGGGSTAAATLRLLHHFGGTLCADEYDGRDTELTAELTKIINQGFQRNRPLVRCEGDDKVPTPFRCYSPKIFSMRKGFGDDATQSRLITIHMRARTRENIPISLPRETFDREALALRNRMLAYRFAYWGSVKIDPKHADPGLEDRSNQIGLPLLAVSGTEEGRKRIVEALRQQQRALAADRADSWASEVLEAALAIGKIGGVVRPGDVAKEVNRRKADEQGVTVTELPKDNSINPWRAGRILKNELELPRESEDGKTARYRLEPGRIEQLQQRYRATSEETPETPKHQSPEKHQPKNPPDGVENTDSGVSGVTGVSQGVTGDSDAKHQEDTRVPF
jgi:hypothetical protein